MQNGPPVSTPFQSLSLLSPAASSMPEAEIIGKEGILRSLSARLLLSEHKRPPETNCNPSTIDKEDDVQDATDSDPKDDDIHDATDSGCISDGAHDDFDDDDRNHAFDNDYDLDMIWTSAVLRKKSRYHP